MAKAGKNYGNESISLLEGAERVRKRPGVIFGSDGLDGCEHAVFEILSNSIDEAREGHGKVITLTHYADGSIEVEDNGRGCPVDWNPKEKRFNWELVYCELYAGGKYTTISRSGGCRASAETGRHDSAGAQWRCTDRMGMHRQVNRGEEGY